MNGILGWFVGGVLPTVLISGSISAATMLKRRKSSRRRWNLSNPIEVRICLAESVVVHTGEYNKSATGIGQAKALALITPSLLQGWKSLDLQDVYFPNQVSGRDLESDLILLGGPRNNSLTQRALELIADSLGVTQVGSDIVAGGKTFSGRTDALDVQDDFGLVIRTSNPFCRNRTLFIISGSHTYGVTAAARFLVESPYFAKRSGSAAVVVSSRVERGHALAPEIVWESNVS